MALKNKNPRLSVNKLGEYLKATPSRRKKIVFDAKYPQGFITKRYNEAENSITDYYSDNTNNIDIILNSIKTISKKRVENDHQKEVIKSNIEALDSFIDCADCIDVSRPNCLMESAVNASAVMTINNLDVSIRPEVLITKNGQVVGGLKLYFSKSHPLTIEVGEYITSLLKKYLEIRYDNVIKPADCLVLDIFTKKIVNAPKSYKRRLSDIEAACEEIMTRWNVL